MAKKPTPPTSWDNIPVEFSLEYASLIVDVSYTTLVKWAQAGEFPAYKIGDQWRVNKDTLILYIHERCVMEEYRKPKEPNTTVIVEIIAKALAIYNQQAMEDKLNET